MLSLSLPQFATICTRHCFSLWLLVLVLLAGSCETTAKSVKTFKDTGGLEVMYDHYKGQGRRFYAYEGGKKTFRIWFKYPGSVTAWWVFGRHILQNSTHVLNKGKQASFLKLSNIMRSDAGKYFVFLQPSGAGAATRKFRFTLIVTIPPLVYCDQSLTGDGILQASVYIYRFYYQKRGQKHFDMMPYYLSFTNGSKSLIKETISIGYDRYHSTTISLPFPDFCVSYFVELTAVRGVRGVLKRSYSCHQDSQNLDFSTVFRTLKGQIYVLFARSTYVPVCFTTPATPLQQCPLLLEEASVIDTPQENFISRYFFRISPLEFVENTVMASNHYCSKLASHCNSSRNMTKRLCWKGESVKFKYRQNNLTLFEGNTAIFLCRLYCSKCKVTVDFVWKRGETNLRQRTGITLNVAKNFKYRLYNAKKTDSGLYTFSIVVGDNVYSNSFFVTVLEVSSPYTGSSYAAENSTLASEIGSSSTWIVAGCTITVMIFIMIAVPIVIVRKYQPRLCQKSCGLTSSKTNLPVDCDEPQCEAEELWTPSPFAIRYASHSCGTFELFVESTKLSLKLEESASMDINKSNGGSINLANYGISIEFPRDALQEERVTITVSIFISSEPVKGRFVSLLELLPHGIMFDRPVLIRSSYHVAGSRSVDSKLHMFYSKKFRSDTALDYVGELSETKTEATFLDMKYFLREEFLEIQALSFCELCSWSEGPCNVAFSVFRSSGSASKFGVTIALSCAHPDILRALKIYHVKENNECFLKTSFCTWDESWNKMEIELECDDEWKASGKAAFTVEARNTVMKCPTGLFLGPTRSFLLRKASDIDSANAGTTTLQFNMSAYKTDLTTSVDIGQIIVETNSSSATKIMPWDPDTLSVYSSPSSGNSSAYSRNGISYSSSEGRNSGIFPSGCLNTSGEHRSDSDGYDSMPAESLGKNSKVTRVQCNNLAKLISPNWEDVARKLSFSEQDINSIEAKHSQNPYNQSFEMLHQWLNREGCEGTVFILCRALISSKARDHAESVFGDKFVKSLINPPVLEV